MEETLIDENDFEDKHYLEDKIDIEGDPNEDEEEVDILSNEVISYVGNYSLPEYARKLENGIFIKPNFQRNEVWNLKQKSKLIESFLASYPVPPVILFKEKGVEKYLIVDGYQRISTIYDFYANDFKLKIQNEHCKNKFYKELPKEAKEKLDGTFLNCTIVREIEPKQKSKMFLYNLFERLNTGGKALNAMETRRAISYGRLITDLEFLNEDENWRKILGKTEIDNRFLDLELLLRLFAFYSKYDPAVQKLTGYSSMRLFLDDFVSENVDQQIDGFSEIFKLSCKLVVDELGLNPFTLHGSRPNYLILDSIMGAILIHKGNITNLKSKFVKILDLHRAYYENKSGTLTKSRVEERLNFSIMELNNNAS